MLVSLSRRQWIKTTSLAAAGFAYLPPALASKMDFATPEAWNEFARYPALSKLKARLFANENPYGPSPMAQEALKDSASLGNRYAFDRFMGFMETLAQKEGVSAGHIMLGAGSSELLDKVAYTYGQNKGEVVSPDLTFWALMDAAAAVGGAIKRIPLTSEFAHDLDAMEAAIDKHTSLVYICNPNNPTGTVTSTLALRAFCERVSQKVPVFVDEAYVDFFDEPEKHSMIDLIHKGHNIIIARTFSKIYGMAGIRVGYLIAQPDTVKQIAKFGRDSIYMSTPSLLAAQAALGDVEHVRMSKEKNAAVMKYTVAELNKLNFQPLPSITNFMFFPINMPTETFQKRMTEEGIGIRVWDYKGQPYCRVSIGTQEEMESFINSLKVVTG